MQVLIHTLVLALLTVSATATVGASYKRLLRRQFENHTSHDARDWNPTHGPTDPNTWPVPVSWQGGAVLQNVEISPIYVGAAKFQSDFDKFYTSIASSTFIDGLAQYDTPDGQRIRRGRFVRSYTSDASVVVKVGNVNPNAIVAYLMAQGVIVNQNANSYFPVHFGPEYDQLNSNNCQNYCAYHSFVSFNGKRYATGMIPDCCGSEYGIDGISPVVSHELVEAITNSLTSDKNGWVNAQQNDEIADICVGQFAQIKGGDGRAITVMYYWSNFDNRCIVAGGPGVPSEDVHLVGIGSDNRLYSKNSLSSPWIGTSSVGQGIDMIQLPDLSFLIISPDFNLWVCSSLSASAQCSFIPNSGYVKSIDLLSDKSTLIGVGLDGWLYTRSGLYGSWNQIQNSGNVVDITVLSNGVLVGTGPDGKLYTRNSLYDYWAQVPNSCCVVRTSVTADGIILGVAGDGGAYQMQYLGGSWTFVQNSYTVKSVTPKASFLGVAWDGTLWAKGSFTAPWTQLRVVARGIDLVQLPDSTFVVIAADFSVWRCPTLMVCAQYPNSGSIKSIDLLPDQTTLIGVGLDNQLYTRVGITSSWNLIPNSGSVVDITVLSSGDVLGTGTDGWLYTKQNEGENWVQVANSCCVKRTAQLADGTILGVAGDNAVYKKSSKEANWFLVPNSKSVVNVAALQ